MKIRIPVVVGSNGRWSAIGHSGEEDRPDWAIMDEAVCDPIGATEADLSANLLRVWVEVDVPVPEEVTVEGQAIPFDEGGGE